MKKQTKQLGVDLDRNDNLRAKLLAEISEYQRQQDALKSSGSYVNFTMIQTYKELIASRRQMVSRLPTIY